MVSTCIARALRVVSRIVLAAIASASATSSLSARADTGEELADALVAVLTSGGHDVGASFDVSNTAIILKDDEGAPLGWSTHVGPLGAIYVNQGKLGRLLDFLNDLFGFDLTTATPEVLGYMAWVCLH